MVTSMARRSPNVIKNTKKLDDMLKRVKALDGQEVRVGWFQGQNYGPENNNLPIATVAMWQEEGTIGGQGNGGGIPPRPSIRTFFSEIGRSRTFKGKFAGILRSYIEGQGTPRQQGLSIGNIIKAGIQESIREWDDPANAPITVAIKGFNDPLIETGKMMLSVAIKVISGKSKGG